mgnify:CR=1 FL=1
MFWKDRDDNPHPHVGYQPDGNMEVEKPSGFHTGVIRPQPSWTVNATEYTRIDIDFSPSTRIENYFNSLSQDQCTKLINQFGKMLDEL